MDKALERTIGLKFDEYGVGGITRSSVERIVGSRSLKSIVTALKGSFILLKGRLSTEFTHSQQTIQSPTSSSTINV